MANIVTKAMHTEEEIEREREREREKEKEKTKRARSTRCVNIKFYNNKARHRCN